MLLSNDIRNFIHSRNWPKGLTYEIRDVFLGEPHLELVMFRDNWITLDYPAQLQATKVVHEVMTKLTADGVPIQFGKVESTRE